MYLFVILPFDSAQGERAVLPYMGCRGMSSLKRCGFLKKFWSEIEYRFWSFWSQTGYGFCSPSLRSKRFRRVWEQRKTEERGFRYFACAENGARAKKRTMGVGEGKEGTACGQTPGF